MWYVIFSLVGGALLLLLALAISGMGRSVTKCDSCNSWAELVDIMKDGHYKFKCPKCGKEIII